MGFNIPRKSLAVPHLVHLLNQQLPYFSPEQTKVYDFDGKDALALGLKNRDTRETQDAICLKIVAARGYERFNEHLDAAFCYNWASRAANELVIAMKDETFRLIDFRCAYRTIRNCQKLIANTETSEDVEKKIRRMRSFAQETIERTARIYDENRLSFLAINSSRSSLILYGDPSHQWFS